MPDQPYYGDPYNQGDFNWTTKFGKKPKTEGDKLSEEGVGEDGGFIDSGELAPDGTVQESRMFDIDPKKHKTQQKQKKIRNIAEQGATEGEQAAGKRKLKDQTDLPQFLQSQSTEDIQSDIVKREQLLDAQRNEAYDQKMREIEASGVTGRAKAAALKEANRLRTGNTGINPADIPDNALQAFNSLATAIADDPFMAADELLEMKRAFDVGSAVGRSTGHPGAGTVAGVTWYAGEQLVDFLQVALSRRVYATAGGPALPLGKTSYDDIIAQGGMILRSATRNINQRPPTYSITTPKSGTAFERYTKARNRLKTEGWLRRDESMRQIPVQTSRGRGRSGNALMVNDLSDALNFNKVGKQRTEKYLKTFTNSELKKLGNWHRHHKRPLSQHSWMLQGLPDKELKLAQEYSYKRMAAGGDVLNNLRITPEGPHSLSHQYMNAIMGEMRSAAGNSIKGLLDVGMDPQDFMKIPTFEGRKAYISRFFDATEAADLKIVNIMNALDISKTKGATISLSEATTLFNKIDDPNDLVILDKFLQKLNTELDETDINALAKINENLNYLEKEWLDLETQLDKTKAKGAIKSIQKKINQNEFKVNELLDRKDNIIPENLRLEKVL